MFVCTQYTYKKHIYETYDLKHVRIYFASVQGNIFEGRTQDYIEQGLSFSPFQYLAPPLGVFSRSANFFGAINY